MSRRIMALSVAATMSIAATALVGSAAPVAATPSTAALSADTGCGFVSVAGPHVNTASDSVFVSGAVDNPCPGWTEACVTTYHVFMLGFPWPTPVTQPVQTNCYGLTAGSYQFVVTEDTPCEPGYYWGRVAVTAGGAGVTHADTQLFDLGCGYQ